MPADSSDAAPSPKLLSYLKIFHQREYSFRREVNREHLDRLAEDHCLTSIFEHVRCKIPEDSRSTFLTAFSPNGKMVASTHGDHKIYVCDVATGNLLHTLEGHPRTPWCIAFHPSCNEIIASGCLGGEVRVWDLHGGSEVWATNPSSVITSLAFHPLDKVLVIATHNLLYFWDWTQPLPFASCATASKKERVRYVKFNKMGNKLITGIANQPNESARIMDAVLCYQPRRPPPLYDTVTGEVRYPPYSTPMEEWNMDRPMPPPPRGSDSSEDAIRHTREYAEAVTLSMPRFFNLNNRYATTTPPSHVNERLQSPGPGGSGDQMEEDTPPYRNQRLSEIESSLMEWAESSENFSALDRDFWRTFRRLQLLCSRIEQQIQQSNSGESSSSSQLPSSLQMLPVQQELESSVILLLTRLRRSLRTMELESLFARDQVNQVRTRINEILSRLRNRGTNEEVQRLFEETSGEPSTSQDTVHRQWCTVCVPPADHTTTWNPQYCLWLLESSLQLTRQMQNILSADQVNSSWTDQEGDPAPPAHTQIPQELMGEDVYAETIGMRRLRLRRIRDSLLQRQNPFSRLGTARDNPYSRQSSSAPLMLRRNLRLQLNSAQAAMEAENLPESSAQLHSSSEEDPSFPPRRSHRRQNTMLDRLNSVLSRIRSHWVENSDSSSDEGAPVSDTRRLHSQLQYRVDRLRDLLRLTHNASPPPQEEPPPPPPQNTQPPAPPLDRSIGSIYNHYISYFYETSIRSRLGSMFGLSDGPTNLTHRIQCWDFSNYTIPNISNEKVNVAMGRCKIHNDGSVAVCEEGHKLMALVPSRTLILVLTVVSLDSRSLGQVLHTCRFGPNVISLSFSPLGRHVLVGLAASHRFYLDLQGGTRANRHTVAQIFRLDPGNLSPVRVRSITLMSLLGMETEAATSIEPGVNTVRWLPHPGQGLVAGTNRGSVTICRPLRPLHHPDGPGHDLNSKTPAQRLTQTTGTQTFGSSISVIHRRPPVTPTHRNHHTSAATQTSHPRTHTTGTQTWVSNWPQQH